MGNDRKTDNILFLNNLTDKGVASKVPKSQTPRKLEEIHKLTLKRYKKYRIRMLAALSFMATAFVSIILMTRFDVEGQPFWRQPPLAQFLYAIFAFSFLATILVTMKVESVSFEKKNFLKIFEAYNYLTRFISLSGSSSQDESDLNKAANLLHKVSSKLLARKGKAELVDVMKEVNERYFKLGKSIQTKIIFYLQKRKELPLIQEKTLELADTFADASLNRLDSCITTIETIPETGSFKPRPTFLETNPWLRSLLVHVGKFSGSFILVIIIAVILATVFSISLSELAPYILTSTFLLFVGWEFKSK